MLKTKNINTMDFYVHHTPTLNTHIHMETHPKSDINTTANNMGTHSDSHRTTHIQPFEKKRVQNNTGMIGTRTKQIPYSTAPLSQVVPYNHPTMHNQESLHYTHDNILVDLSERQWLWLSYYSHNELSQ